MRLLKIIAMGATFWVAPFAFAGVAEDARTADVVILGESHDNPAHHARQLDYLKSIDPAAVVYEMLTPEEAEGLVETPRAAEAMRQAIVSFHWSNIADYADLLAGSAVIVGAALSRPDMRRAFSDGAAAVFGESAAHFGLTKSLPADEQAQREDLQFHAHCQAMPIAMMPGMVEAQRLRDASFARSVIAAVETHGTPVVLITGNGHARTDWGVARFLARVRPDLTVFSLGQSEEGVLTGSFSAVVDAPAPQRQDLCAAFK